MKQVTQVQLVEEIPLKSQSDEVQLGRASRKTTSGDGAGDVKNRLAFNSTKQKNPGREKPERGAAKSQEVAAKVRHH